MGRENGMKVLGGLNNTQITKEDLKALLILINNAQVISFGAYHA